MWKLYPKKIGKQEALKHYKAWRKESKAHTYALMTKYLNKYLKYLQLHQISLQYTLAGYKWFGGRFEDELDMTTPTYGHIKTSVKSSRKITNWKEKQEQQVADKNNLLMSDDEMNQIFKGF